jgi:hypothetical protein
MAVWFASNPSHLFSIYGNGHTVRDMINSGSDCRSDTFEILGCVAMVMIKRIFIMDQEFKFSETEKTVALG